MLILTLLGAVCVVASFHQPPWETGYYAARGDQYFIVLHGWQVGFGATQRYSFPWHDPQKPHDDLNVAGAQERAPFSEKWSFGRVADSMMVLFSYAHKPPCRFSFDDVGIWNSDPIQSNYADRYAVQGLVLPAWMIAAALLAFPFMYLAAIFLCRFAQQHRGRSHRCIHCNYDLRASSDRCPECGKPISPPSPITASPTL